MKQKLNFRTIAEKLKIALPFQKELAVSDAGKLSSIKDNEVINYLFSSNTSLESEGHTNNHSDKVSPNVHNDYSDSGVHTNKHLNVHTNTHTNHG